MSDVELTLFGLFALGWIIFQLLRRVFTPPKPLGTIKEEPPEAEAAQPPLQEAPLDVEWGRPQAPPARETPWEVDWGRTPVPTAPPAPVVRHVPRAVASEPSRWSDAAQGELEMAREIARRQARARLQEQAARGPGRHPLRPQLRTPRDLRSAMVLTAILGPCRALDPYQPPEASR